MISALLNHVGMFGMYREASYALKPERAESKTLFGSCPARASSCDRLKEREKHVRVCIATLPGNAIVKSYSSDGPSSAQVGTPT